MSWSAKYVIAAEGLGGVVKRFQSPFLLQLDPDLNSAPAQEVTPSY